MEQFTASEVRNWERAYKGTGAAEVFNAFADLLEAQEKAMPVVTRESAINAIEHVGRHNGPGREIEARQMLVEGSPSAAHSAQAQPPAASVPTLRYFIGGPKACAYVDKPEHVEAVIKALCECTGDDSEDYTVTDLLAAQENPNG